MTDKRVAPKPNCIIEVKLINDKLMLSLHPTTWDAAIKLSRYYLLYEDGCEIRASTIGPFSPAWPGGEPDTPVDCFMLRLAPSTERAKKFFAKLQRMKMPNEKVQFRAVSKWLKAANKRAERKVKEATR